MKPNVFLRQKGLNWHFRLKGSEFNGNLLDLLNQYKEALNEQCAINGVVVPKGALVCERCTGNAIKSKNEEWIFCTDCGYRVKAN